MGQLANSRHIGRRRRPRFRAIGITGRIEGAQAIEGHEVRVMVGIEHGSSPGLRGPRALEQRPQHAHRGQTQQKLADARQGERLGEQLDDLAVGLRSHFPDALDTALGKLASHHLIVGFRLAKHTLGIAKAQGPRFAGQARSAHAGNLQRHVGAHGQQVVMGVEELEGRRGHPTAGTHDVHDLERGRLDGLIAPRREQVGHGPSNGLAHLGLVGQHIAKSRRSGYVHR